MVSLINWIEFIILGAAVFSSKSKLVPSALFLYSVAFFAMQLKGDMTYFDAMADYSVGVISYQMAVDVIVKVYLSQSMVMIAMSCVLVSLFSRMGYLAAAVVFVQFCLSTYMAVGFNFGFISDSSYETHSSWNHNFVIIYIVIAWMCVWISGRDEL